MKSMSTAPRDREIEVNVGGEWRKVEFYDCAWLRQGLHADPACTDCWRAEDEDGNIDDFELGEPQGWREISR